MTTVTLLSGRQVDSSSEEWILEGRRVGAHVEAMKRARDRQDRALYLEGVARKDGQAMADAVKAAFLTWWDYRQAQAKARKA